MREERETPRRDLGPQLEAGMLTSSPSREVQAGQEAPVRVPSTEEATEAGGAVLCPKSRWRVSLLMREGQGYPGAGPALAAWG